MAVGKLAKSVMGLADEFMEGAAKGIGDAGTIKASVNKMKSNMTKGQIKKLKAFGNSAGDAAKAISRSQAYTKSTKTAAANAFKQAGKDDLAKKVSNMKGMPITKAQKSGLIGFGKADRVAGIQNATLMNRVGDAVAGGFKDTYTGLKSGRGLTRSLSDAYMDGDKLRGGRVVGSFMAASAAGRIATGGGLYKDRNGSTNIIGVPFI